MKGNGKFYRNKMEKKNERGNNVGLRMWRYLGAHSHLQMNIWANFFILVFIFENAQLILV